MNLKHLLPQYRLSGGGRTGEGNLGIHSQQEKRCGCTVCGQTFAVSKGTLFYRLRTDPKIVMCVIVFPRLWLSLQLSSKPSAWMSARSRSGGDALGYIALRHLIGQSQLDLEQVQADEIRPSSRWLPLAGHGDYGADTALARRCCQSTTRYGLDPDLSQPDSGYRALSPIAVGC